MYTKIKLLTLASGMFFFTSCDNGATTKTNTVTDSTKMNAGKSDSMENMKSENGLMTSMNNMMGKMGEMKMSGDFDMDFANMMIEHHQGAIEMSEAEIKSGTDDKLKAMAQKIIASQKEEQTKLRDIVKNSKPMKMDMGKHDELTKEMNAMKTNMSGMQMTGSADKDFSMMMISHHESAIKMAKAELSHGMNAGLKQIAQKIINDQTKEVGEFKSSMK